MSGPQQKGCSAVDVSGGKSKGHAVKDSIASQVALVVKKPPANAGGLGVRNTVPVAVAPTVVPRKMAPF